MKRRSISVLHFSNTVVRSGAEEHILTLLRGLDRTHFRLYLACSPELAEMMQPDLPRDVELFPIRLQKHSHARAAFRLARLLRERRVDILHSHMFRASLFASPIGCLCRVPVVLETTHVREQWRTSWLKSRYAVDRFAGRFVDYYIAVSEANADYLSQVKGLPARKIVVIRNGCDLARFDPRGKETADLRRTLGFDPADPVLLVLGRLEPQKGHQVLLHALREVRAHFPRVRLVCVGAGSLRAELEVLANTLALDGVVRFVGYQSNVEDWLALADITVLPSFYEGLPLAAVESLAAGRPVVATAVDGTPEVVVDEKTGLTVPPGDVDRLAHAVCRLVGDPELRRRLAKAGRRWVTNRFSREQQVRQTQSFYLDAWERSRGPARTSRESSFAVDGRPQPDALSTTTTCSVKPQ